MTRKTYSKETLSAPAIGYTVWQDGLGYRFTTPNGDFDSKSYRTRGSANNASHKHADEKTADALMSRAHLDGFI